MTHAPPQNVNEALSRGGIPEHWTADMLEWLEARHKDLGSRGRGSEHDAWRMRWSNTMHDILVTIAATPKSQRRR